MRRLLLLSLLTLPGLSVGQPFDRALSKQIDDAVRTEMAINAMPAVVVNIERPGGKWSKAWGWRDPAKLIPAKGDESVRIGSVTKTIVTTAVLRLVDQGKVELDAPISRYLDGVPNGENITVRMLGNMSSGIASYTQSDKWFDLFIKDPNRVWTAQELVTYGYSEPVGFQPGKGWHYSNTNIVLLGMLIEKQYGKSLPVAVRELVLEPLGLKNTFYPTDASIPSPHLNGYTVQNAKGDQLDVTHWNPSWGNAAGAMISNAVDLVKWTRALATGALLKPDTFQQRFVYAHVSPNTSSAFYGFGMGERDGWRGHTGELPGYNTVCFYHVKTKTVLVIMVSSDMQVGKSDPAPRIMTALQPLLDGAH